jgi:hypothetical protein
MGKSHQGGWVSLRGKMWYGYFRRRVLDPITEENRVDIVCMQLGPKAKLTKSGAREALRMEVAKQTGQNLGGTSPQGQCYDLRMVRSQPLFPASTGRRKRCRRLSWT